MITRRYGELHGISTASVRLSTPYGPMERVTGHRAVMSVFYDWTGRALRGEAIIAEDMDQGRDYTYVADIAEGLRAVLDAPSLPHSLYNITAGTWVTFQEILEQVVELFPNTQVESPAASQVKSSYGRGPLSGHRMSARRLEIANGSGHTIDPPRHRPRDALQIETGSLAIPRRPECYASPMRVLRVSRRGFRSARRRLDPRAAPIIRTTSSAPPTGPRLGTGATGLNSESSVGVTQPGSAG